VGRDTETVDRLRVSVSRMSSPLTLENSLILACVRTEPDVQRIRELVERCPEWPVIVRKADHLFISNHALQQDYAARKVSTAFSRSLRP
jgi:hypothetical protein